MTKLFQDMRVRTAIIDERPEEKNYPNEKVGPTDSYDATGAAHSWTAPSSLRPNHTQLRTESGD
jgi:hypothetical protein